MISYGWILVAVFIGFVVGYILGWSEGYRDALAAVLEEAKKINK